MDAMSAEAEQGGVRMDARTFFERSGELGRAELVDGDVLPVSPAGYRHGRVEARLARLLAERLDELGRGEVVCGDVGYQLGEQTVRAPDLAVHLCPPASPSDGWLTQMPEVAVEILSPSDRWTHVEQKVAQYFAAGVAEVWIVDPDARTVTVRPGVRSQAVYGAGDVLDSAALDGLELPLEHLFG